ncbi:MAG: glycine--tRNA ligase [Candidatus Aenigmarchaeota archaeon]|nr:glycine--tRNA ligase [Candidatus Aenigmarchaeota archaeon]
MNMSLDKINSIIKRRGFIWKSCEQYGGLSGFYDYGHLGTLMKRKFEDIWRNFFLGLNPNFFEISPSLIMKEEVFKASGHLDHFTDPIVKCSKCDFVERADQILEKQLKEKFEGMSKEEMTELIKKHEIKCPKCGGALTDVSELELMFPVDVGAYDKIRAYLRPETAQGSYLNFSQEFNALRKKLPLGLAVIGKAFRNEISPRQGVYRTREFTQAELQIFFDPEKVEEHSNWDDIKDYKLRLLPASSRDKLTELSCEETIEKFDLPKFYVYYMAQIQRFYLEVLNYPREKIRFFELNQEERAFYNKLHWDFEVRLEALEGFGELCGIHYRTDYDLKAHEKLSGEKQEVFFEEKKFIPHVVELAFGIDRNVYALLELFYTEREDKSILALPLKVAPFDCAVLPLVKKEGLPEKANEIYQELRKQFTCFYDNTGSIGRRYARQDEIGTPLCITIDFDTLKDNTVTVRNRDSTEQVRVKINELKVKIEEFLNEA